MGEASCNDVCGHIEKLRQELNSCSITKDAQINTLAAQIGGMRGDMLRIDGDIKTLTVSVDTVSESLKVIAENTTQLTEMIGLYNSVKGFGFVSKQLAMGIIGMSAVITAIVYLLGLKIHIGV